MKQAITVNVGRETSKEEIEEISSSFAPFFEVNIEKNIIRLSDDMLPLVIDFGLAAIAGGLLYDGLKGSLNALYKKIQTKRLKRNSIIKLRIKDKSYIITDKNIFLKSRSTEVTFKTIDQLIKYIESTNSDSSNKQIKRTR